MIITLVLLSLSFLFTMMGSFIILPSCHKFAKLTVNTVVSAKRLSMVHSDNKLPFEDMLKKSSEYFESANDTSVAYKGAMLFMSMALAEEKAKFLEEKALADRNLLVADRKFLEEKALADRKLLEADRKLLEEKALADIKFLEADRKLLEEKALALEEKALADRNLLVADIKFLEEKALADIKLLEADRKLIEEKANSQIILLEFKLLTAKQAVTSRGILEHFLKGCQVELGLKGNFNAASVCEALKKPQKVIVLYALLLIGFDNIPTLHLCRKLEG